MATGKTVGTDAIAIKPQKSAEKAI